MTGSQAARKDRTGEQVGKYRLVRRIGEGGMGEVYEARHTLVGRREAIKLLRTEYASNEQLYARFQQEAMIAGALESQHIVPVRDLGCASDGTPYMVMDLLDGQSLASLLATHGPFELGHALDIIHQACSGVVTAHAKDVIHRDLKPDNMFVCLQEDGTELVRILDFGIAKLDRADSEVPRTLTGSTQGTLYYMSPEQAQGSKTIDKRTDVYALGVILYELLSGERPYGGDSYNAILYQIITQEPKPLRDLCPELPDEVVTIVEKAMARAPEDRFQSVTELDAALAPFRRRSEAPQPAAVVLRPASAPLRAEQRTLASAEDMAEPTLHGSGDGVNGNSSDNAAGPGSVTTPSPAPTRRNRWIGSGAAILIAGALATLLWRSTTEAPPPVVRDAPASVEDSAHRASMGSPGVVKAQPHDSGSGEPAVPTAIGRREGAAESATVPSLIAEDAQSHPSDSGPSARARASSTMESPRGHVRKPAQAPRLPGDASAATPSEPGAADHGAPDTVSSVPQRFRPLPRGVPSKL